MQLISSIFEHESLIPSRYTCDAENINPPLTISNVPRNAKSLVLIVEDPDAVSKVPWIHWIVFNMDPGITEIQEDSVPDHAAEGMTDFGKPGWGGPCPPSGNHRYFFRLYALDTVLELHGHPDTEEIKAAMTNHILDEAVLIGLYQRKEK